MFENIFHGWVNYFLTHLLIFPLLIYILIRGFTAGLANNNLTKRLISIQVVSSQTINTEHIHDVSEYHIYVSKAAVALFPTNFLIFLLY